MSEHRLIILGTGSIAERHAEQFSRLPGIKLVGAVDTDRERAATFAREHGIANVFASLEDALDWGAFDAAVNATPDGVHHPTTLALIAAKKAVFCEKPLALSHEDAREMTEAAERAGLVNMVNLTYRNAHAIQMARRMVQGGEIGPIRHVEASYLQSWLTATHWGDWRTDPRWLWRLSSGHGSKGVIGDIGIHILDFVTFGTGLEIAALQARMKVFDKAEGGAIGAYTFDVNDSVAMTVEMDNGALGVIHATRYATGNANDLRLTIYGERGALKIWANERDSSLDVCLGEDVHTQKWRRKECPATPRNEARFAEALASGKNGEPDFARAADIQKLLDLCFVSHEASRMMPTGLAPASDLANAMATARP
ncbi:Gfo/Idh/MocA family protein [Pararhizobium mangrovi]|uniref:Gfo/Idh/MocA family oxidoreductase n=1 Tax=Pararhizobium mangrovi TaxID=2590452 RepID=A0A506TY79_9HYPH|nr:Gfo/Idh/MocA family oxidoreductase [Pararhizobium mangrovi]TPW26148.1 Gfo/Idh/MocA family oxidoreductase [Pararhizobium mangrovi]